MITEIEYVNGRDCGAGYDVTAYLDENGEGAARVREIATGRVVYCEVGGETYVANLANGADIPSESDDWAETEWRRLKAS